MTLFKKPSSVIGVDVGASSVKAVELQKKGDAIELTGFGRIDLSEDDPSSVQSAVASLLKEGGFGAKRLASSISGKMVIVRHLQLTNTSEEELPKAVRFEAEKYVPYPLEEAILDWQVLSRSNNGDLDVLLVAARREQVTEHLNLINSGGLRPEVIDLDAFALSNAYEFVSGDTPQSGAVAFVDVGARKTTLNICVDGSSRFTREVSIGGQGFTETLARVLNMSFDEAEDYKVSPGDGAAILEEALAPAVEEVANEIQLSFEWFQSQFHNHVDRVFLSGGSAQLPFFARILGDVLALPVELFDPFRGILMSDGLDSEVLTDNAPRLAVAMGLAARLIRS